MENFKVYRDIQARTGGDIYIGVVGPVRTGKSTFIRRFMEQLALPLMEENLKAEIRDQLPVSGAGKTITTCEPKFIPKEAVTVSLEGEQKVKVRLIDCVGFLVKDAVGHVEEGRERMVKTPWAEKPLPFHEAARTGTQKVIEEHATIGLVVTTDGSFGDIKRENYSEAEEKTINELKKHRKPFLIILNSVIPHKEETKKLASNMENKYEVPVVTANCEQLRREDICKILERILYEFPVSEISFFIPKWVEMLANDHEIKKELLTCVQKLMLQVKHIRDLESLTENLKSPYIEDVHVDNIDLANGSVKIRIIVYDRYYYSVLSELSGLNMQNEYELIQCMKDLAMTQKEYIKVKSALENVSENGYGVVVPELKDIEIQKPEMIRQGNKYGVKIKSKSASVHMIKAVIETEIAPIVGTEEQAADLISYINDSNRRGESIWETNIFGKSIEQLVKDGVHSKIASLNEESQIKLQDTMKKIVNDSKGGLVCIII